ncbi:hypothetical protein BT67DRAFT_97012 [Trichocladium antarcticum]|uniref:Uncharacterized protein n=1 Tax=Trichocladium antarcticum TaxID=1450529 RepID=A0AAN6ZGY8_9PEZI|nr:hypothetical protein BT67DRAFT_97012 [Trichocladium antarcticum]
MEMRGRASSAHLHPILRRDFVSSHPSSSTCDSQAPSQSLTPVAHAGKFAFVALLALGIVLTCSCCAPCPLQAVDSPVPCPAGDFFGLAVGGRGPAIDVRFTVSALLRFAVCGLRP